MVLFDTINYWDPLSPHFHRAWLIYIQSNKKKNIVALYRLSKVIKTHSKKNIFIEQTKSNSHMFYSETNCLFKNVNISKM